eukprot:352583-Chlamydomonas_euryale.AAC.3
MRERGYGVGNQLLYRGSQSVRRGRKGPERIGKRQKGSESVRRGWKGPEGIGKCQKGSESVRRGRKSGSEGHTERTKVSYACVKHSKAGGGRASNPWWNRAPVCACRWALCHGVCCCKPAHWYPPSG